MKSLKGIKYKQEYLLEEERNEKKVTRFNDYWINGFRFRVWKQFQK